MDAKPLSRVLIVEDDEAVTEQLERTFAYSHAAYATLSCASVKRAAKELTAWRPDLVLLDLQLPDGDGLAFLAELGARRVAGSPGVIVVTAAPRRHLSPLALKQGADDFIAKPFDGEDLLSRVDAVLRRVKPREAPPPSTWGTLSFDWTARTAAVGGRPACLTSTEFAILELLAKAAGGLVRTRTLLAEALDIREDAVFEAGRLALKVHVSHLRRKLGDIRAELVLNVHGEGYRLGAPGVG